MFDWQDCKTAPSDGTPFCIQVVVKRVGESLIVVKFPTDGTAKWCPYEEEREQLE